MRSGAPGVPRKDYGGGFSAVIAVQMTPEMKDALARVAAKENISAASLIRRAI